VASDTSESQPHLMSLTSASETAQQPRRHEPDAVTNRRLNVNPSVSPTRQQQDQHCSMALPTSGNDGLPSLTPTAALPSFRGRSAAAAAGSSQCPPVAIVGPLSVVQTNKDSDADETLAKNYCTRQTSSLRHSDDDDETQLKPVFTDGNSSPHCGGIPQRHHDDDDDDDTEVKKVYFGIDERVVGKTGVTSLAANDISQLSINDSTSTDPQTSSTVSTDASVTGHLQSRSTMSASSHATCPASVESVTVSALSITATPAAPRSSSAFFMSPAYTADESLSSIMMPQAASLSSSTSRMSPACATDESLSSITMPTTVSSPRHRRAKSAGRPTDDNCVIL